MNKYVVEEKMKMDGEKTKMDEEKMKMQQPKSNFYTTKRSINIMDDHKNSVAEKGQTKKLKSKLGKLCLSVCPMVLGKYLPTFMLWHLQQFETIVTTNGMHGLGHYIHSDYLGSFLYLYISTLQIYA